jgi:aryl-alcohol dehydrogenase-like predicted oxidoreductase
LRTRRIGSLEVSLAGLGTNNFGRRLDLAGTRAVVDAALDAGVTLLDTADVYGSTRSEEFLGTVLAGRRERVVLATKFGMRIDDARPGGGSPAYLRRALEDSLRRLRTDRIDLYQLHWPDPATRLADTIGALEELRREGKVRELGCSNFSAAQLEEAGGAFASVQNEYSLLAREPEQGVLSACERLGLGFVPYFPLASGLLTGKYRRGAPPPAGTRLAGRASVASDARFDAIEALERYAQERGVALTDVAIGYLLAHAPVCSVIAGATRPEQVAANVAAARWQPSAEDLDELTSLLGRTAPASV